MVDQEHQSGPLPGPARGMLSGASGPAVGPVLLADDDVAGRILLRTFLKRMQLCNPVVEASDGAEVIGYLERAEAGEADRPALMILDLNMPVTSGLDVLRWRSGHPASATVPTVMLTGAAGAHEIEEAYALGVLSYLVKPVGYAALQEVLRQQTLPWAIVCPPAATGDEPTPGPHPTA